MVFAARRSRHLGNDQPRRQPLAMSMFLVAFAVKRGRRVLESISHYLDARHRRHAGALLTLVHQERTNRTLDPRRPRDGPRSCLDLIARWGGVWERQARGRLHPVPTKIAINRHGDPSSGSIAPLDLPSWETDRYHGRRPTLGDHLEPSTRSTLLTWSTLVVQAGVTSVEVMVRRPRHRHLHPSARLVVLVAPVFRSRDPSGPGRGASGRRPVTAVRVDPLQEPPPGPPSHRPFLGISLRRPTSYQPSR